MVHRILYNKLQEQLEKPDKVSILYGPRQVGKTTLINAILEKSSKKILKINAEQIKYHQVFSSLDLEKMMSLIEDSEVLFIDEAQSISNIGLNIKILHDGNKELKIILTGSSSFDLANVTQEPLTGRTTTHTLFPLSIGEIKTTVSEFEINESRNKYLRFGLYPEIYTSSTDTKKIEHLNELATSYLYKDILQLTNIKYSQKLKKLVQLLAYQIGNVVSINKLANALDLSSETVENYIDLLEKSFIVFRLGAYSKNQAKEISKMDKIYFYDIGIRNAAIGDFSELEFRQDSGQMWENFIIAERLKKLEYQKDYAAKYFWRTYNGSEIDYIEEKDGTLDAYEIKYGHKTGKTPRPWEESYTNSKFETINEENWIKWLLN